MNPHELFYPGSQNPEDIDVLVKVMGEFKYNFCRLLEVGVLTGQTARALNAIAEENKTSFEYWGVDPVSPETHNFPRVPFSGANFVQGDSVEVSHLLPDKFNVVLLDGCHCGNHVILETFLYGSRVTPGGFLVFHDTNPLIQQTMKDPHGPNVPWFHNSVNAALKLINFPFAPWVPFATSTPAEGRRWGGMTAFQKL